VISDGGSNFIDKLFEQYLSKNGIHHNIANSLPTSDKWSGQDMKQANQEYFTENSK
jgi:hypothetical protein